MPPRRARRRNRHRWTSAPRAWRSPRVASRDPQTGAHRGQDRSPAPRSFAVTLAFAGFPIMQTDMRGGDLLERAPLCIARSVDRGGFGHPLDLLDATALRMNLVELPGRLGPNGTCADARHRQAPGDRLAGRSRRQPRLVESSDQIDLLVLEVLLLLPQPRQLPFGEPELQLHQRG